MTPTTWIRTRADAAYRVVDTADRVSMQPGRCHPERARD
jgi:hypothetical protein